MKKIWEKTAFENDYEYGFKSEKIYHRVFAVLVGRKFFCFTLRPFKTVLSLEAESFCLDSLKTEVKELHK